MRTQPYTISHTGSVLEDGGEDAVWLHTNLVDPQRESEIAEFRCPTNFEEISWVGSRDAIRWVPRTHEELEGHSDADLSVEADIQPIAGEPDVEDQEYPAVVVVVGGEDVTDSIEHIDYSGGTVTLAEEAAPEDDDVHLFPIVRDGTVRLRGRNALDQHTGPVYPWASPIHKWHDQEQNRQGSEVRLNGSLTWRRNEVLEFLVDSPEEIVWEHEEYPESFVTTLEIDCQITF